MGSGKFRRCALSVVAVLLMCGVASCGSGDGGDDGTAQSQAAIDRYRTYLAASSALLVKEVQALRSAIEDGDRAAAKSRYARARSRYGQVKTMAMSFPRLDADIDAHISNYLAGEFRGFHRIERTLWTGSELSGATVFARRLLENVKDLRAQLSATDLKPKLIVKRAHDAAARVFSLGLVGTEEVYSHLDLVDVAGNVEGIRAAFEAFKPQLDAKSKPATQIEARLATLEARVDRLRTSSGFPDFDKLPFAQLSGIGVQFEALPPLFAQAQEEVEGA